MDPRRLFTSEQEMPPQLVGIVEQSGSERAWVNYSRQEVDPGEVHGPSGVVITISRPLSIASDREFRESGPLGLFVTFEVQVHCRA